MNKLQFLAILAFISGFAGMKAQQAFLTNQSTAVFYPANFNAKAHLPSPVFTHELIPQSPLPIDWKIRPVYSTEGGKTVVTLNVGADDDFYGTGEVYGSLRRNGKEVVFWNKDNYGYFGNEGKNLYQSHPWVLGVRKDGTAYGIIADNTWKGSLTTNQQIRFVSEGPAFRVVVIEGKNAHEVMRMLGHLTGTMEMPPMWALGYQQCRYSYNPDTRVKEIIDSMRIEKIPCDVVWMDIDYMDKFKVFTFDPQQFPDPKALHKYANDRHMKTVYMLDPGIKVEDGYFAYDEGKTSHYFTRNSKGENFTGRVWPGDCNFPDYTNPDVRTWWTAKVADFMTKGVDGLWNDMNEPAVFGGVDGTMDESAIHSGGDGLPSDVHLRYHNIYGMNMVKASRQGILLAKPNSRPFVLSRSNFLGGQRYAATWNGDNMSSWEHLQMSIPMTLNLSLSGQPFNGPDIGGFGADCDAELLAHWTAMGVYFPFVRNHSAKGSVNQEPWAFGKKVEDVCRTAIERRYRLMPYIYTLFREASTTGMPVMRPLFMADEKDLALRAEQRVFMLGDDLMIIPRWAKNPALPKGDWDIIAFEQKDDLYQPYVALRSGAIVPTTEVAQSTDQLDMNRLTLLVNPDTEGKAEGILYEDAGDGFGYRTGDYARYELKAITQNGKVSVSIRQIDGNRHSGQKMLRIGIVTDGHVTYTDYKPADTVELPAVKDKSQGIRMNKLKWSAIDPGKEPTTADKLKMQSEKMKKAGHKMEW